MKTKFNGSELEMISEAVYRIYKVILMSAAPKVEFSIINDTSLKLGVYVQPELAYRWLYQELSSQSINPNSTFYKSWNEVRAKSRFEQLLDQLQHYASTYGTGFQGEAWTPDRIGDLPEFPYSELRILKGISWETLQDSLQKTLQSGIAMSDEMVEDLEFLIRTLEITIDIQMVKNRELKLRLIPAGYEFKDSQECLLWILYRIFSITMIVKNHELWMTLKQGIDSDKLKNLRSLLYTYRETLAKGFLRNKDIFLTLKVAHQIELGHPINLIRRSAKTAHTPLPQSEWLKLESLTDNRRCRLYASASIFKLVQMYNILGNPKGYYIIRNGKAFFKATESRDINPKIREELLDEIISRVPKVESVTLPEGIDLAMPTSEKNFIGDIPMGSTIDANLNNIMAGIYWRNENGARDLDLHVRTIDGQSIGWCYDYRRSDDILFSGDMTNADPEASEVMWFKKGPVNSIISVSEYSGGAEYAFKFYVATESTSNFGKNYMVDPRNIIFQSQVEISNKSEVTLGYFKDGKFVFHSCTVGNGRVPSQWREKILHHQMECSYLTIQEVLELAGIAITEHSEINLQSKGDLINFFSGSIQG